MNTDPMPRRAYAYIRFSNVEQKRGSSVKRQVELAESFAKAHNLGPVDTESFRDLGVSAFRGTNAKGGALSTLLDRIKQGEIGKGDWLIVENLDRLSRQSIEDTFPLLSGITNAGVIVATAQDGQTFQKGKYDIATFMRFAVTAQLANEESEKKSLRLCAAWAAKRSKIGERKMTAKCPGWLVLSSDKQKFTVIKDRVAVVRRIFSETAAGRGRNHIAKMLNEEKVPVWKKGTGWAATTIAGILSSRAVLGEFTPCKIEGGKRVPIGEPIKDYYPPIVSEDDFYAAEAVIKGRRNSGGHSITSANNLFTRLVFCSQCHGPVHYVNKGRGAVYLRCDRATRHLTQCKPLGRAYGPLESAYIKLMAHYDFTGSTRGERAQKEAELASAEAKVKEASRKVERLTEAMMSTSTLPVSTFLPQMERAKAEADRMTGECARLTAAIRNLRDVTPNFDAAKLAKNPDNRFRLREEIRRRTKRLVMYPDFFHAELLNGNKIKIFNDKTETSLDLAGKGKKTRMIFPAKTWA